MPETSEERLHRAVWAFHAAVQRRDGVESRLRRGDLDAELYDRSLAAAEGVVTARVELYRLLMEQGWTPPDEIARDLDLDASLLREPSEHLPRPR